MNADYERISRVLQFLEARRDSGQLKLEDLAHRFRLSPFYFQRLFKRWVGLSPKQFLEVLTHFEAKRLLRESKPLLDVSFEVGLSGPSRLHDLFIKLESMTPGEYKALGSGLEIFYGFHSTPFGDCLIGVTHRGLCELSFIHPAPRAEILNEFKASWPKAIFIRDESKTEIYAKAIFGREGSKGQTLQLVLKGTPFQMKVWMALMKIPEGALISYEDLAKSIQKPQAFRAVANAVGQNPIAFLIPCHRVIQKMGAFGGYRSGVERKKALLLWEASRNSGVAAELSNGLGKERTRL